MTQRHAIVAKIREKRKSSCSRVGNGSDFEWKDHFVFPRDSLLLFPWYTSRVLRSSRVWKHIYRGQNDRKKLMLDETLAWLSHSNARSSRIFRDTPGDWRSGRRVVTEHEISGQTNKSAHSRCHALTADEVAACITGDLQRARGIRFPPQTTAPQFEWSRDALPRFFADPLSALSNFSVFFPVPAGGFLCEIRSR